MRGNFLQENCHPARSHPNTTANALQATRPGSSALEIHDLRVSFFGNHDTGHWTLSRQSIHHLAMQDNHSKTSCN
jgi:hypothetical protein